MPFPDRLALVLIVAASGLLSGCQNPVNRQASSAGMMIQPTPAAITLAAVQADQFQRDQRRGGMSAVIEDIQRCYATTSRAYDRLGLRQCLVFDWFAYRFNQEVNRQMPGLGSLAYFQQRSIEARIGRYGPIAGFTDPAVLGGYLAQGSNTIFAVMASTPRS